MNSNGQMFGVVPWSRAMVYGERIGAEQEGQRRLSVVAGMGFGYGRLEGGCTPWLRWVFACRDGCFGPDLGGGLYGCGEEGRE